MDYQGSDNKILKIWNTTSSEQFQNLMGKS